MNLERADKHHLQILSFSNYMEEYTISIGFLSYHYNENM